MNPLNNYVPGHTLSEGNCYIVTSTSSAPTTYPQPVTSTIGASSGKWYMEIKYVSTAEHNYGMPGITSAQHYAANSHKLGGLAGSYSIALSDGTSISDGGSNQTYFGEGITAGDIIGIYMDLDNNKLYFAKNGTWQNSGDPTSGATGTGAISVTDPASTNSGAYHIAAGDWNNGASIVWGMNFGNGYFGTTAVSSTNADDAGIGSFEYDVPTGYYALCTKNIKVYG